MLLNYCARPISQFYNNSYFLLFSILVILGGLFTVIYLPWLSWRLSKKLKRLNDRLVDVGLLTKREKDFITWIGPVIFSSRTIELSRIGKDLIISKKKLLKELGEDSIDFNLKEDFPFFLRFKLMLTFVSLVGWGVVMILCMPMIVCKIFFYKV